MKKYKVLPVCLGIYALVMAVIGRAQLFNPDTRLKYILTFAGEIVILIALYFFLKKRDKLRRGREGK